MADLKNLHPTLIAKMNKFITDCKAKGINVLITQGFRSFAYQNSLYEQGRTKPGRIVTNLKGGLGPHCYGWAFDFVLLENGKPDWNTRNKKWYLAGEIGEKCGLEWGGRWTKFIDLPHFQLPNFLLAQAKIEAKIRGIIV